MSTSTELNPACPSLLDTPDNIEIIRDQIAALLAVDLQNQYQLATEAEKPDAQDYKVSVYLEHSDPFQLVDTNTPNANPFPLVNITTDSSDDGNGTASVGKQSLTAKFFLDVYASGNTATTDMGNKAGLRAWKAARLIRRILRAESNTYLGLRGIVGKVSWNFQAYNPGDTQSVLRMRIVRITLSVDYVEYVEIASGITDWEVYGIITDENGRVLIKAAEERKESEE